MNDRIDELIALAAFGELTTEEQLELDAAAAADPAVAAELTAELETAASLLAASPVRAPAALRADVLDAIASIPQDGAPMPAAPVVSLGAARERRRNRLVPMLSAAAAVVLVAVGSVFVLRSDGGDDRFDAVAEASDATERRFAGDLGGSLVLFHSSDLDAVVLEGEEIPQVADDKAYVLWTITDGGAVPVGEFRPDDSGTVMLRLDGVDPTDAQLGVTEEPIGGSDVPTLPIKALA